MDNNLEVFNKVRSDLTLLVEKNKGLKINGINDTEGYTKVKEAMNETRKAEIELEKLAKQEREGALNYQRGIISLEKDLKGITSPLIADYKQQLETTDKAIAKEERRVLLPDRMKQLAEVEIDRDKEFALSMDEKEWANFYTKAKLDLLESREQKRILKERADKEEADRLEREKLKEDNDKLKAEKEATDAENRRLAKEKQDKDDADAKEAKRIADEEEDREAKAKSDKYVSFMKECGVTDETKEDLFIKDTILPDGLTRVTVYKKVSSIIV